MVVREAHTPFVPAVTSHFFVFQHPQIILFDELHLNGYTYYELIYRKNLDDQAAEWVDHFNLGIDVNRVIS